MLSKDMSMATLDVWEVLNNDKWGKEATDIKWHQMTNNNDKWLIPLVNSPEGMVATESN